MGTISLRNLGLLTPSLLFRNLTLTLGDTDRLGLVAGNGAGKSSLLRCLAGEREAEEGDITFSRGLRPILVEQEVPERLRDLPMAEALRRALPPETRQSETWRVDVALDIFDTPEALRGQPIGALSGGWQRLAMLARAAIQEPDALLLDEPTNHLDLTKIRLLEDWLLGLRIPMLIASHDRAFLDRCTTRTLFLRASESRLFAASFTPARASLAEEDAATTAKQAKDTREAERLRRSAGELKNIGLNSRSDAAQKKAAQMAKRADALEERIRPAHAERHGEIRLAHRETHAKFVFALDAITIRAPDGRALFRTGKLSIAQGERVVILGANGTGKSCFLSALRGAIETGSSPGLRVASGQVPGYLDQHQSQLPPGEAPQAFITRRFPIADQRATSLLAGAGFDMEQQRQPIARLSPGQRARLGLLALRLIEPNLHLLDEPTNHVDIHGQERLEEEILAQNATVILISHDRHFAMRIGNRFLMIEGRYLKELEQERDIRRALAMD